MVSTRPLLHKGGVNHLRGPRGFILTTNRPSAARGPDPVGSGTRSGEARCSGVEEEARARVSRSTRRLLTWGFHSCCGVQPSCTRTFQVTWLDHRFEGGGGIKMDFNVHMNSNGCRPPSHTHTRAHTHGVTVEH